MRAHLWLSGRVQGVAFRYYAAVKAKEFKVSGYTRNLDDGRVEIVVQGDPKAVDDMIKWCRKGPPNAIVKDVVLVYEEPDPKLATFQVEG